MEAETTGDVVRIAVDLGVPPEQAWALLTLKPHIANWWGDHVELQARLGGRLVETWSAGGRKVVTSGEVTRCDPPSALEMSWADDDWPGYTRVAFRLHGNVYGTRLVLEHSGWSVHPASRREEMIEGHAQGWFRHLSRLARYATEIRERETRLEV
jgi:uncharacterized protein YndB with AHSA1/START domain